MEVGGMTQSAGTLHTTQTFRYVRLPLDALPAIKDGQNVVLTIRTERSQKQHRTFWKMLTFAAHHSDAWSGPEEVLLWIKTELGMYSAIQLGPERRILHFHSTSFAAMGKKEFRELFDRSAALLAGKIGVDPLGFLKEMEGWS